ncbi:MAG: carotenoid oxygenase family protein [Polyangiales bacterium]
MSASLRRRGAVSALRRRSTHPGARKVDVALPGPELPHDMAFTERFAGAQRPPAVLGRRAPRAGRPPAGVRREAPVAPRAGAPRRARGAVRWFEAEPTYVLRWINAYEHGDEVILDGYRQADPMPRPDPADGAWGPLKRQVDLAAMGARPHRWRFDLRTGRTVEEPCDTGVGVSVGARGGPGAPTATCGR